MNQSKRICIVGTGYVGMATAIGLTHLGHEVVGYDVIRERVRGLAAGVTPYHEAGIGPALQTGLASGRLRFVEQLDEAVVDADFVVVAVGTPSRQDGGADLSYLDSAIDSLARCIGPTTVVLRSTVPVGTTDRVARALEGRAEVLYAPEFLREGSALLDFLAPNRIVIGATSRESAAAYGALFGAIHCPRVVTSFRNAELIKAFSNGFLATKISFANEVANFCDAVQADALEVLHAIGLDNRIGPAFLQPGIGFGGPCFEKDVKSLRYQAAKHSVPDHVLAATLSTNDGQPGRIRQIIESEIGAVATKRIGIWGLTFKAGTDDVRDSLAVRVVDDLLAAGAHVRAYDPALSEVNPLVRCELAPSALGAIDDCDVLVVLTEWGEFADIDAAEIALRVRSGLVVDGRNVLDPQRLAARGLCYRGIGRRARPATASVLYDGTASDDAIAV